MKNTLLTAVAIAVGLGMATKKKSSKEKTIYINSDALKTAIALAKRALDSHRVVCN